MLFRTRTRMQRELADSWQVVEGKLYLEGGQWKRKRLQACTYLHPDVGGVHVRITFRGLCPDGAAMCACGNDIFCEVAAGESHRAPLLDAPDYIPFLTETREHCICKHRSEQVTALPDAGAPVVSYAREGHAYV